jgi:hypothetical protein
MMQTYTFDRILELIGTLSDDEQETLVQIIQRRQSERRRDQIAQNIVQAQAEYQRDEVFRGTADEVLASLLI